MKVDLVTYTLSAEAISVVATNLVEQIDGEAIRVSGMQSYE